jgi:uncharacterized membrane protein
MSERGYAVDTVAVYGAECVMSAVAYTVLQKVIVASHGPESDLRTALGNDLKPKLSASGYVGAVLLAFASRWLAVVIFVVVALSWFIPDRRLQNFIESSAGHDDLAPSSSD